MDKLKAIAGGQPLRVQDWELIQNAFKTIIKSLTSGLLKEPQACIVTGMEISIANDIISVTEGFYFDGQEIFYVPAASFTYIANVIDEQGGGTYQLYITEKITSSELRNFKDGSSHNVWEYRQYEIGYSISVPASAVLYGQIPRLLDLQRIYFISQIPEQSEVVQYVKKIISSNDLDQYQVLVPAPGTGKAIQVVSLSAQVMPSTQLEVSQQNINVFFGSDLTEVGLGYFPNQFVESGGRTIYQMIPSETVQIYDNQNLCVGFSAETRPVSGLAQFTFYLIYKIITL